MISDQPTSEGLRFDYRNQNFTLKKPKYHKKYQIKRLAPMS